MALMETKIIQTQNDPSVLNDMNNEMGSFGWSVLSVQITHTQNTKTYTKPLDMLCNTGIDTVETTTLDYATITYQRDKKMPNYHQIVAYENEYASLRLELAERVDEISRKDQVKFKDLFRPEFLKPTLNPKESLRLTKESTKLQMRFFASKLGIDSRSNDAIQKSSELIEQYEQSLLNIRRQAEALL